MRRNYHTHIPITFDSLFGKTFVKIDTSGDAIVFIDKDGVKYLMFHEQDCCEAVTLEDIVGNVDDLLNSPITMASEENDGGKNDYGTYTWTFYKLATNKGYVTLRWYGESNGYYSESVDLYKEVSV